MVARPLIAGVRAGARYDGQGCNLRAGTTGDRSAPATTTPALSRTDDSLWCWGSDGNGQLGNGTDGSQQVPNQIGGFARWRAVGGGGTHTCALRTTGQLYCWGGDHRGQLGNGEPLSNQSVPVQVAGNRTDWAAVSVGYEHTCARRTSGRLFCWGGDDRSQLGNGEPRSNQSVPVQVAGNRTDWAAVSASYDHTCARRSSSRLFCWGYDSWGQLGNGEPLSDQSAPVQVAGNRTDWAGVSVGQSHTCARRSTGRLFCWGADGNGKLGNGEPQQPERSGAGRRQLTNWTAVSAGAAHTCPETATDCFFAGASTAAVSSAMAAQPQWARARGRRR